MANNERTSWQDTLSAIAGLLSAAWDLYDRLPGIAQLVAKLIGAGALSGILEATAKFLWGTLPWPMPDSPSGWAWHIGLLVLTGLGLIQLGRFLPEVFNQLLAPRRFKELPVSLKNQVLKIQDRQPVRTSRTTAWYKDLDGKGLIRDTEPLASNQVMVRPTTVGEKLAQEWREEVKQREEQAGRSPQQRETVNRLVALFKNYIRPVYTPAYQLLERIRSDLSGETSLARLLNVPLDNLKDSYDNLKIVAKHPRQVDVFEAKDRLCVFWKEYITAVRFIHDSKKDGIDLGEEPYGDQYNQWKDRHSSLVNNLQDMLQRPDMEVVKSYIVEWRFDTTFWDSDVGNGG